MAAWFTPGWWSAIYCRFHVYHCIVFELLYIWKVNVIDDAVIISANRHLDLGFLPQMKIQLESISDVTSRLRNRNCYLFRTMCNWRSSTMRRVMRNATNLTEMPWEWSQSSTCAGFELLQSQDDQSANQTSFWWNKPKRRWSGNEWQLF